MLIKHLALSEREGVDPCFQEFWNSALELSNHIYAPEMFLQIERTNKAEWVPGLMLMWCRR